VAVGLAFGVAVDDLGADAKALLGTDEWTPTDTNATNRPVSAGAEGAATGEIPLEKRDAEEAADGIRTHDLLHGKQTL